ncbi:MAG: GntR family transcriptional regulator, partial [bacterium]
MLLNLTELSEEPLYGQISRQLAVKILGGELAGGDELLPLSVMARSQRVSIRTVQKAYEKLEMEGLICAKNGQGFFVTALSPEQKQFIVMQQFYEESFEK